MRAWCGAVALLLLGLAGCSLLPSHPPRVVDAVDGTVIVDTDTGLGSGSVVFWENGHGLVLTCAHVVEGTKSIHVKSPRLSTLDVRLEKSEPALDLAVLSFVSDVGVPVLPVASVEPALYSRVRVIGAPLGRWGVVTEGFFAGRETHDQPGPVLYRITGAFVYPGESGGATVNEAGQLVGATAEVAGDMTGTPLTQMGYSVSLPHIREILRGYKIRGIP